MKKISLPVKGTSEYYEINPTKIICLGVNYADHAAETNRTPPKEPLLFCKSLNVLIAPEENIIFPELLNKINRPRVDYEGELAVIIGKKCKDVKKENAFDVIFGYTCFNDVTARELQRYDQSNKWPWFKSKSLDTFGPIGPMIVKKEDIPDPNNLKLETRVNGKVVQTTNTGDMIFKIDFLIEYISSYFTLEPGDIISTGTPSGIGPLKKGDTVEVEIEQIGILKNQMV